MSFFRISSHNWLCIFFPHSLIIFLIIFSWWYSWLNHIYFKCFNFWIIYFNKIPFPSFNSILSINIVTNSHNFIFFKLSYSATLWFVILIFNMSNIFDTTKCFVIFICLWLIINIILIIFELMIDTLYILYLQPNLVTRQLNHNHISYIHVILIGSTIYVFANLCIIL